jgi:histidine triad (HIT) family protein
MSDCIFCKIEVFHIRFHIIPRRKGDHQDVVWTTHPEWTYKYDQMLENL